MVGGGGGFWGEGVGGGGILESLWLSVLVCPLVHLSMCAGFVQKVYSQTTQSVVLGKDCFIMFKVKVTAEVQNFIECLFGQYLVTYTVLLREYYYT